MALRRSTLGALGILGAGALGIPLVKFGAPILRERMQVQTSDSAKLKGTIKIGVDNFIGYFPLCSPYQRANMLAAGYDQQVIIDKADYAKRMEQLSRGEIHMAVVTVDSYLLNAVQTNFPGLITMVIDVSQGADAIVSCDPTIRNVDDMKKGRLKIAFTPNSPSEHLIRANAVNFNIPQLRAGDKSWRVETDGSTEAAQKCAAGVAQLAALWEPDVTKLLQNNSQAVKIIGTENTGHLIVDVLVVRREYMREYPVAVLTLHTEYFKTLHYYANNRDLLEAHASKYAGVDPAVVKDALKGVKWVNLRENALQWFGILEPGVPRQIGLIEAIESTEHILEQSGDFKKNPLPNNDANLIVLRDVIERLNTNGIDSNETVDPKDGNSLTREFSRLEDDEWNRLRDVGTLRVRPVVFQSGSDELSLDAKNSIDEIANVIKGYPNFRIVVEGHTSINGDPAANLELSRDRAESVARYLRVNFQIDPNRIHWFGLGGTKPLQKLPDESNQEYWRRLPRVVVKLKTETY